MANNNYDDLVSTIKDLITDRFSPKPEYTRGILGDGLGNVAVPDKPDKSYVRFDRAANEYFEVFNRTVNNIDGWPVLIGELPWQPGLTQVVDTDRSVYEQSGWGDTLGSTSPHAPTHEWPDGQPGSDPLSIHMRSVVPLRSYIVGTGTFVYVNTYEYEYNGSGQVWGGTPGIDFSSVINSMASGTQRYMGLYVDPDNNSLGVVTGTSSLFTSAIEPIRVPFPSGKIPTARVRVYGSQDSVQEVDIKDARRPFNIYTTPTDENVWPKPNTMTIGTTEYSDIDAAFAALGAGELLKIGEGDYTLTSSVQIQDGSHIAALPESVSITMTNTDDGLMFQCMGEATFYGLNLIGNVNWSGFGGAFALILAFTTTLNLMDCTITSSNSGGTAFCLSLVSLDGLIQCTATRCEFDADTSIFYVNSPSYAANVTIESCVVTSAIELFTTDEPGTVGGTFKVRDTIVYTTSSTIGTNYTVIGSWFDNNWQQMLVDYPTVPTDNQIYIWDAATDRWEYTDLETELDTTYLRLDTANGPLQGDLDFDDTYDIVGAVNGEFLGDVGIGTTSPDAPLHVLNDTGSLTVIFQADKTSSDNATIRLKSRSNARSRLHFGDENNDNVGSIEYSHSTDSFTIATNNIDRVIIDQNANILGQNELRFYEGANYVGFEAPALAADQIWVLPDADGDNGNVLSTNGSGALSWASGASISTATRIDDGDSPYTILATDHVIFCDTDGGAITANLPAGVEGTHYKIINCGSSGNDLTVDPNGTEQLYGGGAGVALALVDGEVIDIHYNATEGWW